MRKVRFLLLALLMLAMSAAAFAQVGVSITSLRPNWWRIRNLSVLRALFVTPAIGLW